MCIRDRLRGDRRGHTGRIWQATEAGRWEVWRFGYFARLLLFSPLDEVPLRDDVPEDPFEAVRMHVKREWLWPMGMLVADSFIRFGPSTSHQVAVARSIGIGDVAQRVRAWSRKGWLAEDPVLRSRPFQGRDFPLWDWTEEGYTALARHVDALRRAARACGYTPVPGGIQYGSPPLPYVMAEEAFLRDGVEM